MSEKKFTDYMEPLPSGAVQILIMAQVMALLKLFGEIRGVSWAIVIFFFASSLIIRLVKAFFRQIADEANGKATRNSNA